MHIKIIFISVLLLIYSAGALVKRHALTHNEFFKKVSSDGLKNEAVNTGNIVKVGCRPGSVRVRGQCRQLW